MPDAAQIAADLRALFGADAVLTEAEDLAKYESGWRYGKGRALLAVRPGTTADVSRLLAEASG